MLCAPLNTTTKLASAPSDTNNNANTFNNNNGNANQASINKLQSYESPTVKATIREIKSRGNNLANGSPLSPLCSQTATPLAVSTMPTTNNMSPEKRQAISMERLNHITSTIRAAPNIFDNKGPGKGLGGNNKENSCNGGGSLSSGGSDTSLEDLSSDQEPPARSTGLTRSASRVSRFRSAKEFFERLSSTSNSCSNNNNSNNCSPLRERPPLPERPRGRVVSRYTAVALAANNSNQSYANRTASLQNITSSPARSRLPAFGGSSIRPFADSNRSASSIDISHTSQSDCENESPSQESAAQANEETSTTTAAAATTSPSTPTTSSACENNNINYGVCKFVGDNVIIGSGSLLNKRNKQLRIKFDENSALTYEYPSEEVMLAEPDSPASSPVPQQQQATSNSININGDSKTNITSQACNNSYAPRKSAIGVGAALSSYKPSTLLVSVSDNHNIDHKLGVKNLVNHNKPLPSAAKTRPNADQWSANNGSVIYAQSNIVKNGFNSTTTSATTNDHPGGDHQRSQNKQEPHNLTISNAKVNSNGPSVYLNGCRISNNGTSNKQHLPAITSNNHQPINGINNIHGKGTTINSPNLNHHSNGGLDGAKQNGLEMHSNNQTGNSVRTTEDDLNHVNSNNWSNGTSTTSDLLF